MICARHKNIGRHWRGRRHTALFYVASAAISAVLAWRKSLGIRRAGASSLPSGRSPLATSASS